MFRGVDTGVICRWFALTGACASALAFAGCQVRQIRQMYSSEFTCPEEVVKVESLGGERYRVTGCEPVVYQCVSGTCIPNRSQPEPDSDSPAKGATEKMASESKTGKPWVEKTGAGANAVKVGFKFDEKTLLKLSSVPSSNKGAMQLVLMRYNDEAAEFTSCDVGILLNGQRLATPATKKTNKSSTTLLMLELSRATVQEFGLARKMTLRACDTRWSLSDDQLVQIHEFVKMYEEELAWSGDAKAGTGGLLAPTSGWPSWSGSDSMPIAVTSGGEMQGQLLFQLIAPSVFQVEAQATDGTRQGSGVAISASEVATNCHVLEGAKTITLKQKKVKWSVEIVHSDPNTDRCVLHAEHAKFTVIRGVRAYGGLKEGEALYTLGSPNGLELTIANGCSRVCVTSRARNSSKRLELRRSRFQVKRS